MAIGRSFEETIQRIEWLRRPWELFRDIQEGDDDKGTPSEKGFGHLFVGCIRDQKLPFNVSRKPILTDGLSRD